MDNVKSVVENDCHSFDILQLVQVIKEIRGGGSDTDGSAIFFEASTSLAFPSSDIGAVRFYGGDDGCHGNRCGCHDDVRVDECAAVSLPVMNLLGACSPLPIRFSDYIARNCQDADMYRDFLSIAQNRLHGLWIDAHQKYALWSNGGRVAKRIFESMTALSSTRIDFYGGALAQLAIFSRGVRSSAGLKMLLGTMWRGISIRIDENVERLTSVENWRALGDGLRLDRDAAVGSKIPDRTAKFRIALGPLDYHLYKTFLPGGTNHQHLQKTLALYINEPLICELETSCRRSELPPARLGVDEGRIGRTAVLGKSADGRGDVHKYRAVMRERTPGPPAYQPL